MRSLCNFCIGPIITRRVYYPIFYFLCLFFSLPLVQFKQWANRRENRLTIVKLLKNFIALFVNLRLSIYSITYHRAVSPKRDLYALTKQQFDPLMYLSLRSRPNVVWKKKTSAVSFPDDNCANFYNFKSHFSLEEQNHSSNNFCRTSNRIAD